MSIVRIKVLPISLAEPGMVLMRDVTDMRGRILLRTGVTLTESCLASLMRRDIGHISVAVTDERSENELAEERRKTVAHVDALFRNVERKGYMGALHEMIVEYRLEELAL